MHMDDIDRKKIVEWEVEASTCEVEQWHIDAQEPPCNMDGEYDGESHCDDTHVDGDYKVSCELVNPTIGLADDGE